MNESDMLRLSAEVAELAPKLKWEKEDDTVFTSKLDKKTGWKVTAGDELGQPMALASNAKTGITLRVAPKHAREILAAAKEATDPRRVFSVWARRIVGIRFQNVRADSYEEAIKKVMELDISKILTFDVNNQLVKHVQLDVDDPGKIEIQVSELHSDGVAEDDRFFVYEDGKIDPDLIDAWLVTWTESERGWGQRPDGYTIHETSEDAQKFIANYNKKHNNLPTAPDEYTRADGPGKPIKIGPETYRNLILAQNKGELGIWGEGNNPPKEFP